MLGWADTAAAGSEEMSFTTALHTYFAVSSIEGVTVEGLNGVTYTDSLAGGAQVVQEGHVVFDREVDRIYLAAPDAAMKVSQRTASDEVHRAVHCACGSYSLYCDIAGQYSDGYSLARCIAVQMETVTDSAAMDWCQ